MDIISQMSAAERIEVGLLAWTVIMHLLIIGRRCMRREW